MESCDQLKAKSSEPRRGVAWGALLAGALCIWLLKLGLARIATALGYGAVDDGIKGGFWMLVLAGMPVIWMVAWFVARFGRGLSARSGALHGLAAWCLAFALSLLLAQSGHQQLAGNPGMLLTPPPPPAGMGGTRDDGEPGVPIVGGLNSTVVRWGFVLLGLEIAAAMWGGWAGTASLRRDRRRPLGVA